MQWQPIISFGLFHKEHSYVNNSYCKLAVYKNK